MAFPDFLSRFPSGIEIAFGRHRHILAIGRARDIPHYSQGIFYLGLPMLAFILGLIDGPDVRCHLRRIWSQGDYGIGHPWQFGAEGDAGPRFSFVIGM